MLPRQAIAIGSSAGGIDALDFLLPHLRSDTKVSVFIVQHIKANSDSFFVTMMNRKCQFRVKEPCNTEEIAPGTIYFAPPDYHMLIEENFTLTLSADEKVNFSRPSIDVMFETAAEAYGKNLIGIILTGANKDGSVGLRSIKRRGGITIVQNPKNAAFPEMPTAALALHAPDKILSLEDIGAYLMTL